MSKLLSIVVLCIISILVKVDLNNKNTGKDGMKNKNEAIQPIHDNH